MPRSDADPILATNNPLQPKHEARIFSRMKSLATTRSARIDLKDVLVSSCGGFVVNGCQLACRHKFSRTEHADQLRMRLVMVEGGQTGAHVLAEPRFCTGATEDHDSEAWCVVHSQQMRRLRSVVDVSLGLSSADMPVVALFAIFHHREMYLVCSTLCNRRQYVDPQVIVPPKLDRSCTKCAASLNDRLDDPALVWQHHVAIRKADGACYPTKYSREAHSWRSLANTKVAMGCMSLASTTVATGCAGSWHMWLTQSRTILPPTAVAAQLNRGNLGVFFSDVSCAGHST